MKKFIAIISLILFIVFTKSYGQTYPDKNKALLDSNFKVLDNEYLRVLDTIKTIKDSLITAARDNLSNRQLDSLKYLSGLAESNMNNLINNQKKSLTLLFNNYNTSLNKLKNNKKIDIETCKFLVDSIESEFTYSLYETTLDFAEMVIDSLDTLLQIMEDLADEFSEIEKPSFTIGTDILTSYSYKGRKPKINQPGIAPSVSYDHPLGFSLDANMLWLTKETIKHAEFDIGIGYGYDFSDYFSASIKYARLFYKDSSAKYTKTVVEPGTKIKITGNPNNALSLILDYDLYSIISINLNSSYYFGDSYDYDFSLNLSHSFEFGKPLLPHNIDFSPSLNLYYGMLYDNNFKIKQSSGKTTVTNDKKTRGIALFDYELNFSLAYDFSALTISLSYKIDFPVNELKNQDGGSFSGFSLGMSYTF